MTASTAGFVQAMLGGIPLNASEAAGFGINFNHVDGYSDGNFPALAFRCFFGNFGIAPGEATSAGIHPQISSRRLDTLIKIAVQQWVNVGADIRHDLSDEELKAAEISLAAQRFG
ncbi:MAG: hypothetical protein ACYCO5_04260 [Acidobacteriaceae bacterium]